VHLRTGEPPDELVLQLAHLTSESSGDLADRESPVGHRPDPGASIRHHVLAKRAGSGADCVSHGCRTVLPLGGGAIGIPYRSVPGENYVAARRGGGEHHGPKNATSQAQP